VAINNAASWHEKKRNGMYQRQQHAYGVTAWRAINKQQRKRWRRMASMAQYHGRQQWRSDNKQRRK